MWNAQPSDYGGYGGGGGGSQNDYGGGGSGFMNTTAGGSGAGPSKGRTTRMNNIFPSTCADVLSCDQGKENFLLKCGAEVSMVSVVGVVCSVNESAVRVDYEIDDFTGPVLKVKTFNDDDTDNSEVSVKRALPLRTYVRVFGPIRTIGGERAVAGFKIEKLKSLNEITTHMLQVVKARAVYSKNNAFGSGGGGGSGMAMDTNGPGTNFNEASGLSSLQQQIQGLVRAFKGQEGISVRQICENLRGVPEKRIRDNLDFLSSEGHVYSTIDDDHFCATE